MQGTESSPRRVIRILSIDGGGIRGLIPARLLVELERISGRPIAELFDVVAGTSTGGLIGLAAAKPGADGRPVYSAEDILSVYVEDGPQFFPEMRIRRLFDRTFWASSREQVYQRVGAIAWPRRFGNARYLATSLEAVLERVLGETRIADALVDLVIPTYDWRAGRAMVLTRAGARENPAMNLRMRHVARATTAAPTYFPPLDMTLDDGREVVLIDGGVAANNPVSAAYYEALAEEAASGQDLDVVVVSLGT